MPEVFSPQVSQAYDAAWLNFSFSCILMFDFLLMRAALPDVFDIQERY